MSVRFGRPLSARFAVLLTLAIAGCSPGVDTTYGRSRSASINGTGVVAGMLRQRGHEVRAAVRLTDELRDWADVVIRFAVRPGPPPKDEAAWYDGWLAGRPGRRVVYVPYDYNAGPDYWNRAREQLPSDAPERLRRRVDDAHDQADRWPGRLPPSYKETASPDSWFAVKPAGRKSVSSTRDAWVCDRLGGPWAKGVDAKAAALVRDDALKANAETVLLTGDGEPLAMSWTLPNDSRVLALASGTFLLNAALAGRPARWPLAWRTVDWAGNDGDEDEGEAGHVVPRRVALVEGAFVTAGQSGPPSVFDVLRNLWPFLVVTLQSLALGVAATLALALGLRQPRNEGGSDADRPVAHPEALGALLARTSQVREARAVLEAYRRWRFGPSGRGSGPPAAG